MTKDNNNTDDQDKNKRAKEGFLGFSTDNFAELSLEEVVNNEPAVKMIMHYYKQLVDENNAQKNEINTYKTYVDAFERKKSDSSVSAIFFLVSNISIAFGVNILTQATPHNAGWFLLAFGIISAGIAIYFNFFKK